jgi:preprotein translocase subunit SecG
MVAGLLMVLIILTSVFLIILVMIQRGKGGGLAGAFGGMGGQSAFGTKAGDLFTKITIGVAAGWILLLIVTVKVLSGVSSESLINPTMGGAAEVKQGASAEPSADNKSEGGRESTPDSSEEPPAKEEQK